MGFGKLLPRWGGGQVGMPAFVVKSQVGKRKRLLRYLAIKLFFFFFFLELSLNEFLNFSSLLQVKYWRMQVLFAEEEKGTLKIRSDNGRHF